MKSFKRETAVNVSLFVLTALLFCSMLVLCYMNIRLMTGGTSGKDSTLPASEKWQLAGESSDGKSVSMSLIRPCSLCEKNAEGLFLSAQDAASYEAYEKKFGGALGAVFGGSAEPVTFSDDGEKAAYIDAITSSASYLYGSLYAALPLEALPPCFHAEAAYDADTAGFGVRYVFVLPDETGAAYAVCFNDAYDAVTLYPSDAYPYSRIEAEFGSKTAPNRVKAAFVKGTPLCRSAESFSIGAVTKIPALAYVEGETDDEITLSLLDAFMFHPAIAGSFRNTAENSVSFVESGKELYISFDEGLMTFRADQSGIPLSSVLKYYPGSSSYTFSDQIRAVRAFIRSLDKHLTGGDASLALTGIRRSRGVTSFDLKYLRGGVVLTEHESDMTIRIGSDDIVSVTMHPYEAHDIIRSLPVPAASRIAPESQDPLFLLYTFGGDISDGATYASIR